ncbi:MAG TPA: trehalose-phosphatase [Polyangium sp.]|nr:trehalose-phosphatase [Polyangium sp.]
MKRILTAENVEVLAQFAWARGFVALDYDGTLAPLAQDRALTSMRPRTRALLERLTRLYPCAIIANRPRDEVLAELDGLALRHVVGNHGVELAKSREMFAREVTQVFPKLQAALRDEPGLDLENKCHSIAIHYHRSRRKTEVRATILASIATCASSMRIIPGKLVINLMPIDAPNKGDALVALRESERADIALYVGDDVTDEDVFQLDQPGRLLCIRVGQSRTSAANWYLRDQREIDLLLETLVDLRAKGQST